MSSLSRLQSEDIDSDGGAGGNAHAAVAVTEGNCGRLEESRLEDVTIHV
jgi:hypothetical protein